MVMWCGRAENGSSLLVNHDRLTNTQRHRISGAEGVPQQRGRDDACVSARVLRASHVPNQARCGIRVVTDGQGQACMQSGRGCCWHFMDFTSCLQGFPIYFAVPARHAAGKSSLRPVLADTLFA